MATDEELAALEERSRQVVEHAQSLAYLTLELIKMLNDELCQPLVEAGSRYASMSATEREETLTDAILAAAHNVGRIHFALTAHAGIHMGIVEP